MPRITASDLIVGTDDDFVVNLYLAVLGRWPDPEGRVHFNRQVDGRPEARRAAILELANSPEAMQRGLPLSVPDPLLPAEPMQALQAQLALRSEYLHSMAGTPAPLPATAQIEAVAPLLRELRGELDALRRELRERLAELPQATIAPPPAIPDMADYVNDMLSLAEARMEIRVRGLERSVRGHTAP
jgi:hypothetical protein